MSKDDPKKHRVDRFLSGQPHEIAYVRRKLARENPGRDPADIERIIHAVRALVAPSESRAYFMLVCRLALNPPQLPAPRKRRPLAGAPPLPEAERRSRFAHRIACHAPPKVIILRRMTLLKYPQLRRLSPSRKRALADALWSASFDDTSPVTPAQQRLLDERAASVESGAAKLLSWDKIKARATRRR